MFQLKSDRKTSPNLLLATILQFTFTDEAPFDHHWGSETSHRIISKNTVQNYFLKLIVSFSATPIFFSPVKRSIASENLIQPDDPRVIRLQATHFDNFDKSKQNLSEMVLFNSGTELYSTSL